MRKKIWISLAVLLVIPGLLFTVSCAKKKVVAEPSVIEMPGDEAERMAAERARQEELARQRAFEEERLREQQRAGAQAEGPEMSAARSSFVNEDIHFDFDRSTLRSDAQEILRKKAEFLLIYPGVSVVIEGHCDERGTNEYNLALGDRRAESAKAFLINLGIAPSRLTTVSYGEERPADPAHDEDAWAKNRRASFVIQ
jgi:peptidoglycan-associated lipoprotein